MKEGDKGFKQRKVRPLLSKKTAQLTKNSAEEEVEKFFETSG